MKPTTLLLLGLLLVTGACQETSKKQQSESPKADVPATHEDSGAVQVQGHRGDRGNFPENSLPAFFSALEKGVDVLEMDVVISKDGQVVVSHEPFMAAAYVLTPSGKPIETKQQLDYNLYQMTYDSIRLFDIGSKGNSRFLQQKRMKAYKPLLAEVLDSVEARVAAKDLLAVKYNIELKSRADEYNKSQPEPAEFVETVLSLLREEGLVNQVVIQSFDVNILKEMHRQYPGVELSYLVSSPGIESNLELLGFVPEIYSPDYQLVVNEQMVDSVRTRGMQLIPWTVNTENDIQRMIRLEVDGIISDYPERVLNQMEVERGE